LSSAAAKPGAVKDREKRRQDTKRVGKGNL